MHLPPAQRSEVLQGGSITVNVKGSAPVADDKADGSKLPRPEIEIVLLSHEAGPTQQGAAIAVSSSHLSSISIDNECYDEQTNKVTCLPSVLGQPLADQKESKQVCQVQVYICCPFFNSDTMLFLSALICAQKAFRSSLRRLSAKANFDLVPW